VAQVSYFEWTIST